jgi:copper homeostasis protein
MLEVCCGSLEDAKIASECGIRRIELNSALHLGGLTPSLGSLILVRQETNLEVMCMIRNRGAGFCYSESDYRQMKMEAELLVEHGADGIVFGFLKEDQTIDEVRTKEFVEIAHDFGRTAVFHRAFDLVKDPFQAIETLIKLQVDRVLTSGQAQTAQDGIPLLKRLQEQYGDRIELLAGCGIQEQNAKQIMEETGIRQLHGSCKKWVEDPTTSSRKVSFGYQNDCYEMASKDRISKLLEMIGA